MKSLPQKMSKDFEPQININLHKITIKDKIVTQTNYKKLNPVINRNCGILLYVIKYG